MKLQVEAPSQLTLYAYLRQATDQRGDSGGLVWNDATSQWNDSSLPQPADGERITLTARTGVEKNQYDGETSADLGSYSGNVTVYIVNDTTGNPVGSFSVEIKDGVELGQRESSAPGVMQIYGEAGREQEFYVTASETLNPSRAATGGVLSAEIAPVSASPSFTSTTNAAIYTGSPGIYKVVLTADETDVTEPQVLRITTSDGVGDNVISFGRRQLEEDWLYTEGAPLDENGGLAEELLSLATNITSITTAVDFTIPATIAAIPTAAENTDELLDRAVSGHVTAGTVGERIERLDILGAGGAGELTTTRAANLDNLDAAVSDRPDSAGVQSATDAALRAMYLHYCFETSYSTTTKPGASTAYFNQLVENDGGEMRFPENLVEQAPSGTGGGGATAEQVAEAVLTELVTDHTATANSLAWYIAAIHEDTNEIQSDQEDGGRLDALWDGAATSAEVGNLHNLSTSDIDTRLAAIGLDSYDTDYLSLTVAISGLLTHGDANWTTAAGFSTHAASDVTTHIDANSTELADIKSTVDGLATDWASPSGSLYTVLAGRSSHSASDVTTDMDANSTKLDNANTKVDSLHTDWAVDGRLESELAAAGADNTAAINRIDVTTQSGGALYTLAENAQPPVSPNLTATDVSRDRTWVAKSELLVCNLISCNPGDIITLAMDFTQILNPETSVSNVVSVTAQGENAGDLTITEEAVNRNTREANFRVTGQQAGHTYTIRVSCQTTDGDTLSRDGILKVSG